MKEKIKEDLANLFSEQFKKYVDEHGTKGLCWFCKDQYKFDCKNICECE